jgi:hypothetical protein
VVLDRLIDAIGTGVRSSRALVDQRYSAPLASIEPNVTRCTPSDSDDRVGGVALYDLAPYYTGIDYASQLASRALMNELYDNGPAVAVLKFVSLGDFDNFVSNNFLKGGRVFMPNVTTWSSLKRHCVTVIGWGIDSVSGHAYWLVQNSYGATWADDGFGRILRGADLLEGEWRGLFLAQNASSAPAAPRPPPHTRPPVLMPSSDIVLITFFSALTLAGVVVAFSYPNFFVPVR